MRTSARATATSRESARLLGVLDQRLAGRDWVMGAECSIADISLLGWVRNLIGFYEARELVGFDRFSHVERWFERGLARPAVQRGLAVTAALKRGRRNVLHSEA